MKKILLILVLLFLLSGTASAKDKTNYLDNGTLYNSNIHHRRPAKAIHETWETRREKSLAENLSFSLTSNFRSRYVFQAMASSNGWVWQPSASVEFYGLGFNVWGNFVIDNIPDQGKFNEIDLTLYYNMKFWGLTIHPYILFCIYPTSNKLSLDYSAYTDIEPSLHLAYSLGPIDIYSDLTVYLHPKKGALYLDLGLGLQQKIIRRLGVEAAAQIGMANSRFNRHAFNTPQTRFNYFEFTLAFPWNPIKGLVIKPNANVSTFFSQRLRNAVNTPVLVWGGVDIAYNF